MDIKEIHFIEIANGGMFYLGDKTSPKAHIDFSKHGADRISADSTEVKPELRGQGVAKKLVLALIEYASENNVKIIPVCSYVVAFFKKNLAYQPLLAEEANL